jgi:hypothetical protein
LSTHALNLLQMIFILSRNTLMSSFNLRF